MLDEGLPRCAILTVSFPNPTGTQQVYDKRVIFPNMTACFPQSLLSEVFSVGLLDLLKGTAFLCR